jgi:hypothetical protein
VIVGDGAAALNYPDGPELGGRRARSREPLIARCTALISFSIPVWLDLILTAQS